MAKKLGKKATSSFKDSVLEEIGAEVNHQDEIVQEAEATYINEGEKEAIQNQHEQEEKEGASTEKLKRATALLSKKFNLDNTYHVTNFKDAGKVVTVTLENRDFGITIQIKDSEKQGLVFDQD